jgi:hypothetical protein
MALVGWGCEIDRLNVLLELLELLVLMKPEKLSSRKAKYSIPRTHV